MGKLEVMKTQIEELRGERKAFDPKKNINKRTVDLEKNWLSWNSILAENVSS